MENNSKTQVATTKESRLTALKAYTPTLKKVSRVVGRTALWSFAALGAVTAIGLVVDANSDEDETEEN